MNNYEQPQDDDQLFGDEQAAAIIGTTASTLRKSRNTGKLWGCPTPEFLKFGRTIRYKGSTLRRWKNEKGKVCRSTADVIP